MSEFDIKIRAIKTETDYNRAKRKTYIEQT